jgi:beta-aspartyl-peptidase (threonine type)
MPSSSSALILANAEIKDEIIQRGISMLRYNASAADVAEYVAREVEDDPDEHSVGYSGYPNILGEVELDASFMDGATLQAGAVAALRGFRHPISVARQVAQRLPHVFLAGSGAIRFADEIGAERREMLSDYAKNEWRKKLNDVDEDGSRMVRGELIALVNDVLAPKPNESHDTMNVIVRDAAGHLVSAVTTSGLAWKYPGRVGDSPVIGAGNYCDDRYGAAACMGLGEITIRLSSCARAIFTLAAGKSLSDAGGEAVREMLPLLGPSTAENHMERADWIRMLLIDKDGNIGGFATRTGLQYKVQALAEDAPQLLDCEWVR